MIIKRMINGVEHEFELTEHEMTTAYYEKQREFDREDIETVLDSYTEQFGEDAFEESYGITIADAKAEMDILVEYKRDIQDDSVDWCEAVTLAIERISERT